MPVDTSGINAIISSWVRGVQLAQNNERLRLQQESQIEEAKQFQDSLKQRAKEADDRKKIADELNNIRQSQLELQGKMADLRLKEFNQRVMQWAGQQINTGKAVPRINDQGESVLKDAEGNEIKVTQFANADEVLAQQIEDLKSMNAVKQDFWEKTTGRGILGNLDLRGQQIKNQEKYQGRMAGVAEDNAESMGNLREAQADWYRRRPATTGQQANNPFGVKLTQSQLSGIEGSINLINYAKQISDLLEKRDKSGRTGFERLTGPNYYKNLGGSTAGRFPGGGFIEKRLGVDPDFARLRAITDKVLALKTHPLFGATLTPRELAIAESISVMLNQRPEDVKSKLYGSIQDLFQEFDVKTKTHGLESGSVLEYYGIRKKTPNPLQPQPSPVNPVPQARPTPFPGSRKMLEVR